MAAAKVPTTSAAIFVILAVFGFTSYDDTICSSD
jgi:hypothetical protein